MKPIAFPIMLISVGTGWLLTVHNVVAGVNWIWVLMLGMCGLLTLLVGGINKATVVAGPFLISATFFSLLRQTGRISIDTEVPLLMISLGVWILIAQLLPIPMPKWLYDPVRTTTPNP